MQDSNNKDGDDEQRFLRMFSKQLADALRAKDEEEVEERERTRAGVGASNKNISSSLNNKDETKDWERLRTSYVELCHDDPIVSGGNGDCRRLAKALVPKQQQKKSTSRLLNPKAAVAKSKTDKLGLSSRLVDGILQATSRATSKAGASSSASNDATQNDKNNDSTDAEEQSMFSPSITTSEGYAEIAFAIFVEGPYRCIQKAEDLQTASNFLGSFLPSNFTQNEDKDKLDAEERSRLVDEATAKLVSGLENIAIEGTENGVSLGLIMVVVYAIIAAILGVSLTRDQTDDEDEVEENELDIRKSSDKRIWDGGSKGAIKSLVKGEGVEKDRLRAESKGQRIVGIDTIDHKIQFSVSPGML